VLGDLLRHQLFHLIDEILPNKVRRILGIILLSIAAILLGFGLFLLEPAGTGDVGFGGIIVIILIFISIMVGGVGAIFLMPKSYNWFDEEDDDED